MAFSKFRARKGIQVATTTTPAGLELIPVGGIVMWSSNTTIPTGFLECNGATSVSKTTYSVLFSAIGTTFTSASTTLNSTTVSGLSGMSTTNHVGWGIAGTNIPSGATIVSVTNATTVVISANATATTTGTANISISPYGFTGAGNTTTFDLPDFRGRIPVGALNPAGIGSKSGAETHGLVSGNIPDHSHAITAHTHSRTAANAVGSMNDNSANHAHNLGVSAFGVETGNHTHAVPDHNHNWLSATDVATGSIRTAVDNTIEVWTAVAAAAATISAETNGHSHNFSVTSGLISTNHQHGFTTSASASNTDNGNTTGGAFAGTALNHMNPFTVVRFLIKH